MAQFLRSNHFTLENTTVHFELHFHFFKVFSFKIVFSLFLQNTISFFSQTPRCFSNFRCPLFELLLIRLKKHYFLIETIPIRCKKFTLLLKEPPFFAELTFPLCNNFSPLLQFDRSNLQVSKLAISEVSLIVLSLLLKSALQILYLLIFGLYVEISNALLGPSSLVLSLESLFLEDHDILSLSLKSALLLEVYFILLVDQGSLGLQFL